MIFHFREENQEKFFFQRTALVGAVADRLLSHNHLMSLLSKDETGCVMLTISVSMTCVQEISAFFKLFNFEFWKF